MAGVAWLSAGAPARMSASAICKSKGGCIVFVRRLVITLFLGAVVAGLSVGAAGAGGFKEPTIIPAAPPATNVDLPAICQLHFNFVKQTTELNCDATIPNPDPPKDRTTVKFTFTGPKGNCKVTAWPDGSVAMACRFKGVLL